MNAQEQADGTTTDRSDLLAPTKPELTEEGAHRLAVEVFPNSNAFTREFIWHVAKVREEHEQALESILPTAVEPVARSVHPDRETVLRAISAMAQSLLETALSNIVWIADSNAPQAYDKAADALVGDVLDFAHRKCRAAASVIAEFDSPELQLDDEVKASLSQICELAKRQIRTKAGPTTGPTTVRLIEDIELPAARGASPGQTASTDWTQLERKFRKLQPKKQPGLRAEWVGLLKRWDLKDASDESILRRFKVYAVDAAKLAGYGTMDDFLNLLRSQEDTFENTTTSRRRVGNVEERAQDGVILRVCAAAADFCLLRARQAAPATGGRADISAIADERPVVESPRTEEGSALLASMWPKPAELTGADRTSAVPIQPTGQVNGLALVEATLGRPQNSESLMATELDPVSSMPEPTASSLVFGGSELENPEKGPRIARKGDETLLGSKRLVSFITAEEYLGIRQRQRQKLVSSGALVVEGRGQNRKITSDSLRAYLPPEIPH